MAVSRGRELANQENPDPDAVRKSITALEKDAEHIRKCIKAKIRDYDSGQTSIDEINDLIRQLNTKL